MKSVLISIQPKWCELIASGKKTIEVRKTKPNIATPFKVYIYCSGKDYDKVFYIDKFMHKVFLNGNGKQKVIGEFVCDDIGEFKVFENGSVQYWNYHELGKTCLTYDELANYIGKNNDGYGWHISNLVIYDKPRELYNFQRPCNNDCENCEYLDVAEVGAWEHTAIAKTCLNFITRPPQSWMYCESEVDTE